MNITKVSDVHAQLLALQQKYGQQFNQQFTFIKLDAKNQYSMLDKEGAWEAFLHAIQRCRQQHPAGVHIAKNKRFKSEDGFGFKDKRRFHNISWEMILNYVRFELDTAYVSCMDKILFQCVGVPMGAFFSPCLALIYCMWKEKRFQHTWAVNGQIIWSGRFRDDCLLIMVGTSLQQTNHGKQCAEDMSFMYGGGMIVEVEACSCDTVVFVDIQLISRNGGFDMIEYNKNFDGYALTGKKVRYPEADTTWDSSIMVLTMQGVIMQVKKKCSRVELWVLAILKHFTEWVEKGYKQKWILRAASRVEATKMDVMRKCYEMVTIGPF